MKYCIQRLFVENVTALIKMRRFLEGIRHLRRLKKVKRKPVHYRRQDVTFFRRLRHFAALMEKKAMQEPMPYTAENVRAMSCPHSKLTNRGYL